MFYFLYSFSLLGCAVGLVLFIVFIVKKKIVWLPTTIILSFLCMVLLSTTVNNHNSIKTFKDKYETLSDETVSNETIESTLYFDKIEFNDKNYVYISIVLQNGKVFGEGHCIFDGTSPEKDFLINALIASKFEKAGFKKYTIYSYAENGLETGFWEWENGEIKSSIAPDIYQAVNIDAISNEDVQDIESTISEVFTFTFENFPSSN